MAEVAILKTKKAIQDLSVESQVLYKLLRVLGFEEFISYHDLSEAIGRDVQEEGRGNLRTAINKCLMQDGIVIKAVYNEGIKRISDRANVGGGESVRKKIRGIVARRRRELHATDYASLSKEDQVSHNAQLSLLGAHRQFATERVLKKIEEKVEQNELPFRKTIEFFSRKK